ncbi:MAG: HK97 gp10 family phage protein [Candidatus Obscuribacter sp.]|nr:HK97 gp10 family phage protein [Candidatus Obscuribacter sp.]
MTTQDEINTLIRKLRGISPALRSQSKRALKEAAWPMVAAIRDRAPMSPALHKRYKDGKEVAIYYPGNLKRSIRVLALRRTKDAVLIGSKLDTSGAGGTFRGNRTDGFYAAMVEYGTIDTQPQPFFRPGAAATQDITLTLATKNLKKVIDNYANSIAI